ncbi:tumor protein p53-inducible nuclear protein 2 [Brachyhypopomus gauderio]|uniref:tumor protein p53-inducible nuclear protein 2 n=1 Tax=Brachyhypopomus gauderio TaxID=698409 RepID=UPI004040F96A
MFQRLTDLLFGRLGNAPQESAVPKSGGLEEDEDWLLVNISADEEPLVELNPVPSTASVSRSVQDANSTTASLVSSNSMEDQGVPAAQSSGPVSRGSVPQAKLVRAGRRQSAQARSERRCLGHHCIRRQNRVRQRLPRHTSRSHPMILQQPSHRNLCH